MRSFRIIVMGVSLAFVITSMSGYTVAQQTPDPQPKADAAPVEVVKTNGDVKVKLNFQDTPLQTVLEYLSETAGLTIVSDEPIADSRMTVISRQPIPLDQAVSLINSMLKEKGLTTVLTGKTLKVVTLANAKKENIPVLTGRDPNAVVAGDTVVTYVVPVGHVTAVALAENLKALLPEYASLEANQDGNALIITDTTANIKRLMQIVVALDTQMAMVSEIRVFRLVNADATATATLINSIFQQQSQSSGRNQQGGFRGPMEMMMEMRGGQDRGRGNQGDNNQRGGAANVQVVAAADQQTNSVVVRGPAEALTLVASVIESLDDRTAKVADVRVFQLRYADAMNTADVINQLFGESQTSSRSSSRSGRGGGDFGGPMMFRGPFGQQQDTSRQDGGGSAVQVTAAADSRTNTVVVTGPEAVLAVVDGVIQKLDAPLSNVADVKVFRLEYADASDTAELINEVFGQSRTTSSRSSSRSSSQQNQMVSFRGGPGGMAGSGGQQGSQATSTSDITVVASADTRTNSVVVSGPSETLVVIAQVIKELDANPAAERRIFVYALKNANCTNLMTILNNLFQEMQALNQQVTGSRTSTTGGQRNAGAAGAGGGMATGGGGASSSSNASSSGDSLSEETYFQADPNTNSLLVMTSSKNYDKIRPIVEELDKPVGQVLIKVLFAEVTHTNSLDLGTEFSMLNLRSSGGSSETTGIFGKPATMVTEAGAARATGLSIRTLEGDIDITLRALEETGKLNVLSRPYVLTRNNQMATITVAEEVPIPSGTSQGTSSTITNFSYRDDIGIVLEVTPSINPEGLVNMTVAPRITTRTGETVQISENLFPSVFATRSASTRVAVLDGQTIVIGGLIEDQIKDTVKKIPLLGDIPLVGALFRRSIKEKTKTELLIFLTPFVAKEPKALTPISEAERARSNLDKDEQTSGTFQMHMDSMENKPVK